eukprot:3933553-Pyramimonas_sp.AAC.1
MISGPPARPLQRRTDHRAPSRQIYSSPEPSALPERGVATHVAVHLRLHGREQVLVHRRLDGLLPGRLGRDAVEGTAQGLGPGGVDAA